MYVVPLASSHLHFFLAGIINNRHQIRGLDTAFRTRYPLFFACRSKARWIMPSWVVCLPDKFGLVASIGCRSPQQFHTMITDGRSGGLKIGLLTTTNFRKGFDSLIILMCWHQRKQRSARVLDNPKQQRPVQALIGLIMEELGQWKATGGVV